MIVLTLKTAPKGDVMHADAALQMTGVVLSTNISEKKGTQKMPVSSIELVVDHGVAQDAHAGDWHRQVSLLAQESIEKAQASGLDVEQGDFGENITVQGLNIMGLPLGTILDIGDDAVVEISQIGKVCHVRCAIYYAAGDCIFPREGVFAVVRSGGRVKPGDVVRIRSIGNGVCNRTPQAALDEFLAQGITPAGTQPLAWKTTETAD